MLQVYSKGQSLPDVAMCTARDKYYQCTYSKCTAMVTCLHAPWVPARVTYVHPPSVLQGLPVQKLQVYGKGYLCTCSKRTARVTCVHAPCVLQGLHVYLLQVYCKGYLFTCSKCTVRVTCVHAPSVLQCEMNLRSCCLESHVIKTSLFELHPTLST